MDKIRKKPVDWRSIYQNAPTNIWDSHPHEFTRFAAELAPKGNAIDLGCGEGYDSLFLAEKGFAVTAVDVSKVALSGLSDVAKSRGLDISTNEDDVRTFKFSKPLSLLTSYGVLHFLGDNSQKQMKHFQEATIDRGIHSLYVFGDTGDFYDIAHEKFWFPSMKDLEGLYAEWDVNRIEEKNIEMLIRGDNGELLHNNMIKLLAQK